MDRISRVGTLAKRGETIPGILLALSYDEGNDDILLNFQLTSNRNTAKQVKPEPR